MIPYINNLVELHKILLKSEREILNVNVSLKRTQDPAQEGDTIL